MASLFLRKASLHKMAVYMVNGKCIMRMILPEYDPFVTCQVTLVVFGRSCA